MHHYLVVKKKKKKRAMHALSHNRTSIRVVITENGGMRRTLIVIIRMRMANIVSMLVVVVGRGGLGAVKGNCSVTMVLIGVKMELRIVGQLPHLRPPTRLPDRPKNLLLFCPSGDRHFLHAHVYLNIVHTCMHA